MKYPWPSMAINEDKALDQITGEVQTINGENDPERVSPNPSFTYAKPLQGVKVASKIKEELKCRIKSLTDQGVSVGLATVLVGDDEASQVYVSMKHKDCKLIGIESLDIRLPATTSQNELLDTIEELNENSRCSGMIVQLPLPLHLDQDEVLAKVNPTKDADGLHPWNLGTLVSSISSLPNTPKPCTPYGIIQLLREYGLSLAGKTVCVVGRGITVGRPLALMLSNREINSTCILCHTATKNIQDYTREAQVVVAAAGVAEMITPDHIQEGTIVIDVGVSRKEGKTQGDVARGVELKASYLTPNPGGIGPMTRAMLLSNIVCLAEAYRKDKEKK